MFELGNFDVALALNEIILTAAISPMQRNLLAGYRMNAHRGEDAARDLILRDIRDDLDRGALKRATDRLIVLALFLAEANRCERRLKAPARRHRDAIRLQRWRDAGPARRAAGKAKGAGRDICADEGRLTPEALPETVDAKDGES